MQKFLLLIFTICLFLINPVSVNASTNFTTDYQVKYDILESGLTKVNIAINLKNNTAKNFATEYQLFLGFDDVSNFKAADLSGAIDAKLKKLKAGFDVSLPLNRKAVGLSSQNKININFDTKNVAQHASRIWEINIPGVNNSSDFNSFDVTVNAPASFGRPAYIKPDNVSKKLTFNKKDLEKSGISIGFGKEQYYKYDLIYHLKNPNLYPIKTTIALPPDTNYQKVYIDQLDPKPNIVSLDQDGNWLAEYSLSPTEQKNIKASGKIKVTLVPKSESLKAGDIELYTRPTQYWQSSDPAIIKATKGMKNPRDIYNFVVNNLQYDFNRVVQNMHRKGSVSALSSSDSAVCREFTDLFIALARAKGIPARELNGFAYTNNQVERPLSLIADVLHAWPEYYDFDRKAWIMVDPTWGQTTRGVDYFDVLDFDHLTFVRKGISDSFPIPAGGYKSKSDKALKDVRIEVDDGSFSARESVKIKPLLKEKNLAGFPVKAKVEIINTGRVAIDPKLFHVTSKNLNPKDQVVNVPQIPPFGRHLIELRFDAGKFWVEEQDLIKIKFGDELVESRLRLVPFFRYI